MPQLRVLTIQCLCCRGRVPPGDGSACVVSVVCTVLVGVGSNGRLHGSAIVPRDCIARQAARRGRSAESLAAHVTVHHQRAG